MKKKLLLITILFTSFIVSGCTVNYEVNINNDLSVSEKVGVTVPTKSLDALTIYESYSEVINGAYTSSDYYSKYNSKFEEINSYNTMGGVVTATYEDLDSYINNSPALYEMFESISINNDTDRIYISLGNFIPLNEETSSRGQIDEINLTIKSPYKIDGLKNANCSIDKNTFICKLKLTQNSKIDYMNLILNKSANTTKTMIIYLISAIIVVGLFAGVIYLRVNKANKI